MKKKFLTAAAVACAISLGAPGIASAQDATPAPVVVQGAPGQSVTATAGAAVQGAPGQSVTVIAGASANSDGTATTTTVCSIDGVQVPCDDANVPSFERPDFSFDFPAFHVPGPSVDHDMPSFERPDFSFEIPTFPAFAPSFDFEIPAFDFSRFGR